MPVVYTADETHDIPGVFGREIVLVLAHYTWQHLAEYRQNTRVSAGFEEEIGAAEK